MMTEAEETPKPTRRRSGKTADEAAAAPAAAAPKEAASSDAPEAAEKKPASRRTRKAKPAEDAQAASADAAEVQPAPKRRGRPRKTAAPADASPAPSASPASDEPAAEKVDAASDARGSSDDVPAKKAPAKRARRSARAAESDEPVRAGAASLEEGSAPTAADGAKNAEVQTTSEEGDRPARKPSQRKKRASVESSASEALEARDGVSSAASAASADASSENAAGQLEGASASERPAAQGVDADREHDVEAPAEPRRRARRTVIEADQSAKEDDREQEKRQDGSRERSSGRSQEKAHDRAGASVRQNGQKQGRQNGQRQGNRQNDGRQNDRQGDNRQNGRQNNASAQNNNHRRQRRGHQNQQREVVPSVTMEDLAKLKVAELREKAAELGVDVTGLKKAELVEKVYASSMKAEGFVEVSGILDTLADGYGFLRTQGYLPGESDVYVGLSLIRRNGLRKGDLIVGQTRPARENEKNPAIQKITSVNGIPVEELGTRVKFSELTPVYPDERLLMEHGKSTITARVIDLTAPIGKGQRGLIVSPPKAGKTTILKDIAASITANNPDVHLMCLLVDERPEEVTDMQRSVRGEVIASTFDMPSENHIAVAELVIERAKRLVEAGKDVVILLDSITRLARAYNLAQPASGRILSGGVDSTALYPPKRFLGAARNIENGGSLTILASALIDTGSKMDEVIFEEFKGTGNMELKLDRNLADRRIFPAIDPVASGTRKEDLLLNPQEAPLIWAVRRILANMNNTERAMDMLIKSLKQTETNQEFLMRTAKKAQHGKVDDATEL